MTTFSIGLIVISGRQIIHLPQTGDDALGARVHKPASQPDQTLAFDLFAQRGLTCAQHDRVGWQLQVVDFVHAQESILRLAALVQERQDQTRKFGILAVEQIVCGEVDKAPLFKRRLVASG